MRTALYRYYEENQLLYVGVSHSAVLRAHQHRRDKAWFDQVTRSTITWYDSRDEAEVAEALAIRWERPHYNIQHNTSRRLGSPIQGALLEDFFKNAEPWEMMDLGRNLEACDMVSAVRYIESWRSYRRPEEIECGA